MIEIFILILWTIVIVMNAQIDSERIFRNQPILYTIEFLIRFSIACFFTLIIGLNKEKFNLMLMISFLGFLGFYFWWLFDSIMGLVLYNSMDGVGKTSRSDKFQQWLWSRGIPPIVIWWLKFFLMFIPLSYYINAGSQFTDL